MSSSVATPSFGEMRGAARDDVLAAVLRSSMRAFAEAADLVHAAVVARSYRDDLYRDVRAWVRAVWNCSKDDASLLVATGKLMAELPVVADAVRDGLVSFAHLRELVRLHRNPRAGHLLAQVDDVLAEYAVTLRFPDFVTMWTTRLLLSPYSAGGAPVMSSMDWMALSGIWVEKFLLCWSLMGWPSTENEFSAWSPRP